MTTMEDATKIVAVACIAAIEIINMFTAKIDGAMLGVIAGIIGGIAGYKVIQKATQTAEEAKP